MPARYLCLTAPENNNISFTRGLALGLTCLVSIGSGHDTASSLTTGNKRLAEESRSDGIEGKHICLINPTEPFYSRPQPLAVDSPPAVELIHRGWTLDDDDLIYRKTDVSEDTQKLWLAFEKLRDHLAAPGPSLEILKVHMEAFEKQTNKFMSRPRSYLESRIFFSMAKPLMPLSQYMEERAHWRLQYWMRTHRARALVEWMTRRNEDKSLVPGYELGATFMDTLTTRIKQRAKRNYDGKQLLERCFSKILQGVEDVELYKMCIGLTEKKPLWMDKSDIETLFIILAYYMNSEVGRDVLPSTALSFLHSKVQNVPTLQEQLFVAAGWTLNNFNLPDEVVSRFEREATGEVKVERKFFELKKDLANKKSSCKVYGKLLAEGCEEQKDKVIEGKLRNWMSAVERFLAKRHDYRAVRSVIGMLPSLVSAKKCVSRECWNEFRKFAVTYRARALEQWLKLSNDASFLLHGQRFHPKIMDALCQAIAAYAQMKVDKVGDSGLSTVMLGVENPQRAQNDLLRMQQVNPFKLDSKRLRTSIVFQLFCQHAGLTDICLQTLHLYCTALMEREAPSFEELVRDSGIDKSLHVGCMRAVQQAPDPESANIWDALIAETVHAYANSWIILGIPENTAPVLEYIMTRADYFSEAVLFSALTGLICIRHRCGDKDMQKHLTECISLCENWLVQKDRERSKSFVDPSAEVIRPLTTLRSTSCKGNDFPALPDTFAE